MSTTIVTREQWLNTVAEEVATEIFAPAGFTVPKNVRYTCGFPSRSALRGRNQRIGECWPMGASGDATFEICVSPIISDAVRAADILVHEMVHATVGLKCGHRGPFAKCARAVGLEGKLTNTVAGEALKARLATIINKVGSYPHAGLKASVMSPSSTRPMVKIYCPHCEAEGDRFIVRIGEYSLARGIPICPIHNLPMVRG